MQRSERRRNRRHTGRNWLIGIFIAVIIIIVGVVVGRNVSYSNNLKAVDPNSHKKIQVEIKQGATATQVATNLKQEGAIKDATVFTKYISDHNLANFKAGYFVLRKNMNVKQVATALNGVGSDTPLLTNAKHALLITEGESVDQIAAALPKHSRYSKTEFMNLMTDQSFMNALAQKYPDLLSSSMSATGVRYHLEGYLFPAVYDTSEAKSLKGLVEQMVSTTNQRVQPYLSAFKQENLTVQQALTLASLAQKEANSPSDMQEVAGVFFNRIKAQMPLQSDVSVQYALQTHKPNLSLADLKVDSPYNLYANAGYGPGPFNNPGTAAMKAIAAPTDEAKGYLYFVANMKTGKIHFSKTLAEQNAYTAKYQDDNNNQK
ncbi:endolytic transglycosylase MltG [Furfurilactobacillus curtus]|uniref:Endolytic murein transglycosylase n=1 Tax=Furfurilactobacillus curtus TaxID=1746200 RepID=A0ABQ5JNJ3_9LACO